MLKNLPNEYSIDRAAVNRARGPRTTPRPHATNARPARARAATTHVYYLYNAVAGCTAFRFVRFLPTFLQRPSGRSRRRSTRPAAGEIL